MPFQLLQETITSITSGFGTPIISNQLGDRVLKINNHFGLRLLKKLSELNLFYSNTAQLIFQLKTKSTKAFASLEVE